MVANSCLTASAAQTSSSSSKTITAYTSVSQMPGYAETKALLSKTFAAATYFVSPGGSDKNNGASKGSAFKSLQHAVSKLKPGDTLYLLGGVYRTAVRMKSSGTASRRITIKGVGNVVVAPPRASDSAFDTGGQDYILFQNIRVQGGRCGIEIESGSHHIAIDGLNVDKSQYGVHMDNASNITVQNARVTNGRNGFRAQGLTQNVFFENIETSMNREYKVQPDGFLNGDGFIFESKTRNLSFRNIKTSNNSDAGMDIKGSNVLIENVVSRGNTNGLKLWGRNVVVRNALIHDQRNQYAPKGRVTTAVGLNARAGSIRVYNSTFLNNPEVDVKAAAKASIHLENSIVARTGVVGKLRTILGKMTFRNMLWFRYGRVKSDFAVEKGSVWANPQFANLGAKDLRPGSSAGARGFRPFALSIRTF